MLTWWDTEQIRTVNQLDITTRQRCHDFVLLGWNRAKALSALFEEANQKLQLSRNFLFWLKTYSYLKSIGIWLVLYKMSVFSNLVSYVFVNCDCFTERGSSHLTQLDIFLYLKFFHSRNADIRCVKLLINDLHSQTKCL